MIRQKKLIWQIFPASLIIVLGAIIAVSWYSSVTLKEFYIQESINDLEARAKLLENQVASYLQEDRIDELRELTRNAGRESLTRITVINKEGVVLADSNEQPQSMNNHRNRPEIAAAYTGSVGSALRYSATLSETLLYVALPLYKKEGQKNVICVLRMSVPLDAIDRTLAAIRIKVVFGSLVVVLLATLVTLLVSRNVSKPLEEMTRKAKLFAKGDFNERMLATQSRSASLEVATLSGAMDRMAELLDEKIKTIDTHRKQLETVFSSMVESVIAIDRHERIISLNTSAAKLFGVDQNEAVGKILPEIIRHIDLQEQVTQILDTKESIENEIVIQDDSGDIFLQTHIVQLTNGENDGVGVLVVLNDVTRMRRLEEIRRDFVANVSHELRTPITSIQGYVETLLDGALDSREDSEHFLQIVLKQASRLNNIIDDLLSLSRIEQDAKDGSVVLEEGPLCLILESAMQTCQMKADKAGVSMELDCMDELSLLINPTLIEQAVVNLLVNAITYSDAGSTVYISARADKKQEQAVITVKDSGVGIAKEHLARLFERFYRSDKARSRKVGGTGLGLSIVKHIVGTHNGHVDVKSEPGVGTEFTISLPYTEKVK